MMKRLFFCAIFLVVMISCNKDEAPTIVGSYELSEILADPGDGSGKFEKIVNSGKVIEFKKSEKIKANGDICDMSTETASNHKGSYSLEDSTISMDGCQSNLRFTFSNDELIIIYPCFEACQVKYVKL